MRYSITASGVGVRLVGCGLLLATWFTGAGCGADDGGTSATAIASPDDLIDEVVAATCARASRCLRHVVEGLLRGESCTSHYTPLIQDGALGIRVRLANEGKLRFDGALAGQCVARVRNEACDSDDDFSECDAIFTGTAKAGEPCSVREECGPAGTCAGATCPGSCRPRSEAGGPCTSNEDCVDSAACSKPQGTCFERISKGQPCSGLVACADGLECVGLDVSAGKLGACGVSASSSEAPEFVKVGEACLPDVAGPFCEAGAVCEHTGGTGASAKFVCARSYVAGGPCRPAFPDGCPTGTYCPSSAAAGPSGEVVCTPLPALGQPCASSVLGEACPAGAACVLGVCAIPGRLGDACNGLPEECVSERCSAHVCAAPADCGGGP